MADDKLSPADDPVYSRKVLEMITVANEFCLFLEKAESYTVEELFNFLQKISPLIYLKSALLPDVEVADEDAVQHYVTEEQWESMFNILYNKFGEKDQFFFVDLHEKSHNDPVKGSLAESFTDIYQDLKDFLLLYQNPMKAFKENAVNECKRLFESRYGYRLVNAQTAIHCLLYPEENNIVF
ncbi:MAG: DUF5063 domain-containing protein [Bacteroidales bacterium]|nr:DUF5063 domain-containing protein [Bacteroidales bacterium]